MLHANLFIANHTRNAYPDTQAEISVTNTPEHVVCKHPKSANLQGLLCKPQIAQYADLAFRLKTDKGQHITLRVRKPGLFLPEAKEILLAHSTGTGWGHNTVMTLASESACAGLLAESGYKEALWLLRQGESAARLQEIARLGTRAGEDVYLDSAVMASQVPAQVRDWDMPKPPSSGSRVRRLQRRHRSAFFQVIDFQKELPEDKELDERQVPGLPEKPECSFDFIEDEDATVDRWEGKLRANFLSNVQMALRRFR